MLEEADVSKKEKGKQQEQEQEQEILIVRALPLPSLPSEELNPEKRRDGKRKKPEKADKALLTARKKTNRKRRERRKEREKAHHPWGPIKINHPSASLPSPMNYHYKTRLPSSHFRPVAQP